MDHFIDWSSGSSQTGSSQAGSSATGTDVYTDTAVYTEDIPEPEACVSTTLEDIMRKGITAGSNFTDIKTMLS